MPIRPIHYVKYAGYELERNILVEEVAHAVDEDGLRLFPGHGQFEGVLVQGQLEGIPVVGGAHGLQPFRHAFGIAVLAAGADLGASGEWVPSGFGPLYGGLGGHS